MRVFGNVELINYTADADKILVFSKRTRLSMTYEDYNEVLNMSEEEIKRELQYVFGTIGSSLEFVDYIFLITNVSRAFTHQLVRHRHASYAQQSQRTVDMSGNFGYIATGAFDRSKKFGEEYDKIMDLLGEQYASWIKWDVNPEDARGVLPTNVATNILAKFNLRSLSEMIGERQCIRVQDEFRKVADLMKQEILKIHPWTEEILLPTCVRTGYCKWHNFEECPMKIHNYIKNPDVLVLRKGWKELMI